MKKSDAKVYLEAARRLAEGEALGFSCIAVNRVVNGASLRETNTYADWFRPKGIYSLVWLHTAFARSGKVSNEAEMKEWRLTALCFMAAIAASEGE